MKRAFSDHWKGVAAGLAVYAAFFTYLEVKQKVVMRQWEEEIRSASLASVPVTPSPVLAPAPMPEPPSPAPTATADVPCPCPESTESPEPVSDSQSYGGLENQATAVVENPDGIGSYYSPPWFDRAMALLTFVLSGAVAALIGSRVVAWRGAVTGVLGGLAVGMLYVGVRSSEVLWFAVFCLSVGLLGYAGGGLTKLLTRARTRPA